MAKSKRSRRARRQEKSKRPGPEPVVEATTPAQALSQPLPAAGAVEIPSSNNRKGIDFAREYFYVYTELRNIILISLLMLVVLVGLSFVI